MPKSESISEHVVRFFFTFGEGENAEDILTSKSLRLSSLSTLPCQGKKEKVKKESKQWQRRKIVERL